ncbi:MAG: SDR family NAD(P)-dependent oxidoreductase [Pirellulaceae bacterium]|nr:SDR family NAD(P)-dependent oxidoreductase [Pirellulaceae bacterium]
MKTIRGKKALLTGAASGIGYALALELAMAGADLYLLDIDEEGLKKVKKEILSTTDVEVHILPCDLSDEEAITKANQKIIDSWGKIDLLINNAGICYYGPAMNMTAKQWQKIVAVNLNAPIQMTHQWLPVLMRRPEAHIVNVASVFGLLATRRCALYHATKFGLVGFSKAIRAEVGNQIGVSTICPGMVRTNLFSNTPSGIKGKETPLPPTFISVSSEYVAKTIIKAIRKNRHLVVITWFAKLLFFTERFFPSVVLFLQWAGRKKGRLVLDETRPAALNDLSGYIDQNREDPEKEFLKSSPSKELSH